MARAKTEKRASGAGNGETKKAPFTSTKGKIYARIQFIGEDGRRKDKKVLGKSRKDARELVRN